MKNGTLVRKAGVAAVAMLGAASAGTTGAAAMSQNHEGAKNGAVVVEERYFCNVKALNADQRKRHEELTRKLLAKHREVVETEKGYEFQYAPEDVSVAEVAAWVEAESKCCPFFDFHIDLEKQGRLVCLRLTGGPNIKAFIRSEFGLKELSPNAK